ncbi:MAG: methyltransferase domain-containing protein [Chloroflexi bacterium]|nr:methyltransferase domain-containing protein [Chloroflexota bacterium]
MAPQLPMIVSPAIADARRLRHFVAFVRPRREDEVLDVAPGTGLLAGIFARRVRAVAVLAGDAGPARLRRRRDVTLHKGSPEAVPFADDSFDIVSCGSSFHHLPSPKEALAEMARVCRPGGRLVLEDIVASEQTVRARYQDRLEKLRDRAHPGYFRLSEFVTLLGQAGLPVRRVETHDLPREFHEWLIGARPLPQKVELMRRLMTGAQEADLSGLDIHPMDDTILFTQRIAWIIAEKPD